MYTAELKTDVPSYWELTGPNTNNIINVSIYVGENFTVYGGE